MIRYSLLAASLLLCGRPGLSAEEPDPAAIAERAESMMGADALESVRVLSFTWAVERDGEVVVEYDHSWDRATGDYRVEGVDRESGKPWIALFNIDTREGRAWLGDEELSGDALTQSLERAYGRFINDSYWLLMPWKWRDPGVHLTYTGRETLEGREHDVVGLTFENGTGLTSGDRYWGYVDPETGRLSRWQYVLQQDDGSLGEGEPTAWDWIDWTEIDPGVWLSLSKVKRGEGPAVRIFFPRVALHVEPSAELLAAFRGE